jgi:hypothetical protein
MASRSAAVASSTALRSASPTHVPFSWSCRRLLQALERETVVAQVDADHLRCHRRGLLARARRFSTPRGRAVDTALSTPSSVAALITVNMGTWQEVFFGLSE